MKKWLIKTLYNSLDDWMQYEVYAELKCPSLDSVLAEQGRQAERLFGKQHSPGE